MSESVPVEKTAEAPGRDAQAEGERGQPASVEVWPALLKTLHHFFPDFRSWLASVPDPRDPRFIVYPIGYELAAGLMLFLTKLGSRRQMRFQFGTACFLKNLNLLCGTSCETMLHPDTLAYLARRLPPAALEDLRLAMIRTLLRQRCFEQDRLLGRWYRVAIDMTGHLVFNERHCDHCLSQKQGEKTLYLHMALEAKLVTPSGFCLSLATEFVENPQPDVTKQDCERKALVRLAGRLKRDYPQLSICLLMDGLYACGPVFELCRKNRWRFIVTFKEGSACAVFEDYQQLKAAGATPRRYAQEGISQVYQWVNGVAFSGHAVNVLECLETRPDQRATRFVWATNLPVDETNHVTLATDGGRQRWKIENQGFNIQKNNGYELEHAYSENECALKNFYLLLQIAHIIAQLLEKGLLAKKLPKEIGALRNIARLLLEELRRVEPDLQRLEADFARRIQIRLYDSS
jgi:hypothetical protein